jgi:hypothetical protein
MDACYGIYVGFHSGSRPQKVFLRDSALGAHQASLSLAERGMRLRLLQSLTFTFFCHLSRQRLLYKIGIALQIPLSVMGLKRFYQSHTQTEGSLGASECMRTFSHSIDQTKHSQA